MCIDVSLQYGMSGWYRLYDVPNNRTQHSIHMSLCQTQTQTNMDGFQTRALNLALELAERTVHQYGEHGRVAASPPVPPARPRSRSPILRRPREARRPDSPETPSCHNVGGKSVGRGPEGQSRGTGKGGGHAHHKGNTRSIGTKGTRRGSSNGNNNADNGKGSTTTRQHRGKGPGSRKGVGKGLFSRFNQYNLPGPLIWISLLPTTTIQSRILKLDKCQEKIFRSVLASHAHCFKRNVSAMT